VYRNVSSGGSFGASPLRESIGIGRAKMIDELIVKWPASGIVQVFKNIAPCQFLKIREDGSQPVKMNLHLLNFSGQPLIPMIDCAPAG
jgi:hypothetical protein